MVLEGFWAYLISVFAVCDSLWMCWFVSFCIGCIGWSMVAATLNGRFGQLTVCVAFFPQAWLWRWPNSDRWVPGANKIVKTRKTPRTRCGRAADIQTLSKIWNAPKHVANQTMAATICCLLAWHVYLPRYALDLLIFASCRRLAPLQIQLASSLGFSYLVHTGCAPEGIWAWHEWFASTSVLFVWPSWYDLQDSADLAEALALNTLLVFEPGSCLRWIWMLWVGVKCFSPWAARPAKAVHMLMVMLSGLGKNWAVPSGCCGCHLNLFNAWPFAMILWRYDVNYDDLLHHINCL